MPDMRGLVIGVIEMVVLMTVFFCLGAADWVGGADEMRFIRQRGGLSALGLVDREAEGADTLEGPWDEVAMGLYGELTMLKGERMVEIAFLTSSTDIAGAIRLAGPALRGLAAAK